MKWQQVQLKVASICIIRDWKTWTALYNHIHMQTRTPYILCKTFYVSVQITPSHPIWSQHCLHLHVYTKGNDVKLNCICLSFLASSPELYSPMLCSLFHRESSFFETHWFYMKEADEHIISLYLGRSCSLTLATLDFKKQLSLKVSENQHYNYNIELRYESVVNCIKLQKKQKKLQSSRLSEKLKLQLQLQLQLVIIKQLLFPNIFGFEPFTIKDVLPFTYV